MVIWGLLGNVDQEVEKRGMDFYDKMLYLAMMDITKKWTGRRQDWSMIYAQLVSSSATVSPNSRNRPARQG